MTLVVDWSQIPLGRLPDREIARQLHVGVHHVRQARYRLGIRPTNKAIDWDSIALGALKDAEIAAQLGVCEGTVRRARWVRGIGREGVCWDRQPLGQAEDSWIALCLGVSRASVRRARRERGIHPPFWSGWEDDPEIVAIRVEAESIAGRALAALEGTV